jgi:dolichol-phosphate mannosyltransferase
VRVITRMETHDCTSGYRCWRRAMLASLPLDRFTSDGYSFLVEMLYVAHALGARVAEVPITFVERRQGESKMSTRVMLESALTPWRLIATRSNEFRAMV